jgi:hypothetical protein
LLGCGRTPWAKAPKAGDAAEEGESAPGASFKDANESIWQSPSKNGDVTDVDEDARSIAATQPELARPASRPADAREDVGGDFGVVEPIMSSPIGRATATFADQPYCRAAASFHSRTIAPASAAMTATSRASNAIVCPSAATRCRPQPHRPTAGVRRARRLALAMEAAVRDAGASPQADPFREGSRRR